MQETGLRLVVGRTASRGQSSVLGNSLSHVRVRDLLAMEPFCLLIFLECLCFENICGD